MLCVYEAFISTEKVEKTPEFIQGFENKAYERSGTTIAFESEGTTGEPGFFLLEAVWAVTAEG